MFDIIVKNKDCPYLTYPNTKDNKPWDKCFCFLTGGKKECSKKICEIKYNKR